jgi:putative phosphoserine phosphatase/1-acylglycerol-3-phosphate O-acyltransferase
MSVEVPSPVRSALPASTPCPDMQKLLEENPHLQPVAQFLLESRQGSYTRGLQLLTRSRRIRPDRNARPHNPHRTVAFFDIDGTMLRGSIIQQLTRQGFEDGRGELGHVFRFLACFLLYKLNLIPRVTMYRWGYEPAVGQSLKFAQDFVDRCLETRIKPLVFREAQEAVAAHRAAGHRCVAITGAPDYAAAELCAHLGMDDLLATPTPLDDQGCITSDVQEPVCYSDGKLDYLMAYAAAHDVDLSRSYFYSDSASDVPVLKAVGHPRVVNSQFLLLPLAVLKGWPRATWNRLDHGGLPVAARSRALGLPANAQ